MHAPLDVRTGNTILYVRAWAETAAFYRTALGFPVTHETDWFVEFRIASSARLSIADAARATIPPADGQGVTITFEVPDADEAWARLRARGLEPGELRDHAWGARVFYLHDPAGHRLEVWSPHGEPTP